MPRILSKALLPALLAFAGETARACLVCHSSVGHHVRDGIFNGHFLQTLLLTVAPFPIFLSLVALLYFTLPVPILDQDVSTTERRLTAHLPLVMNS